MHSYYVQNRLRTVALAVWGLLRPNQRNEATSVRYYCKGVCRQAFQTNAVYVYRMLKLKMCPD